MDLGKRIPPLVGWIDVVEQAPDGTITVADLKTASKRYSDHTVHGKRAAHLLLRWEHRRSASTEIHTFVWTCF